MSDEELCSYCDDYPCELWEEDGGYNTCSKYQALTELTQEQYTFFQQHEAQALKEQMERVMGAINNEIRALLTEVKFTDKMNILEVTVRFQALKSQLESE